MASTASLTLQKAKLFVSQARRADPNDRDAISTNLEAAIVFCRSVTFHLQSQFTHAPGFEAWYAQQQALLRSKSLSRFLLEQRNYVLKVGPAPVRRVIDVSMTETIHAHDEVSIQIVRGQPWYRRSLRILVDDLQYQVRQAFGNWLERRRWKRRVAAAESPAAETRDNVYFAETEWMGTPALDLVEQQILILAPTVQDAEERFLKIG